MRNVNFAICSLIIFLIILIQFGFEKRPKTAANRFFNVFTVFAMADILLNIFSALFAIGYYSISPLMTKIFIFVFHLVSLTMPFLLMLYTLFLRHDVKKKQRKAYCFNVTSLCFYTHMHNFKYFRKIPLQL